MRRTTGVTGLVVLVLTGCTGGSPPRPAGPPATEPAIDPSTGSSRRPAPSEPGSDGSLDGRSITLASALQPFDSCGALLQYFKREALRQVGPYGLGGGYGIEGFARRAGGDV